jgi:predicted lipoprotein with Yx(FWY)xxD motif
MRTRWWAAPAVAGAAVVIAACGSSAPSTSSGASSPAAGSPAAHSSAPSSTAPSSSTAVIKTHSTSIGTVLTNAQGHTLYWFAIDTPTMSKCTGSCASFWPPVLGKATAASGMSLPKGFGTITRSGGQLQATYDGHPLYTYVGDTSAGTASGNGKNLSGGLWWAMTPTGAKLTAAGGAASPSPSASSSSGGGYGY